MELMENLKKLNRRPNAKCPGTWTAELDKGALVYVFTPDDAKIRVRAGHDISVCGVPLQDFSDFEHDLDKCLDLLSGDELAAKN